MCSCATPSANDATERVAGERPRCCKAAASDDDDDACLTAFFLGGGERWREGEGWKGWRNKEGHERRRRTSEQKKTRGAEGRRACEENQGGREGWREDERGEERGRKGKVEEIAECREGRGER